MDKFDVIILGGGPAGISAVLWCKRLGIDHLLIEANSELGGQLHHIYNEIIDYPGVYTKNGKEFQEILTNQVERAKCNIKLGCSVLSINSSNRYLIYYENGKEIKIGYNYLIIATGSKPRALRVPGEAEMIERKEVYSATRDKERLAHKCVAIIGGGDRAFEGAFILAEAGANVHLIHRSSNFLARKPYQERVFKNENVHVFKNTSVRVIHGKSRVEKVDIIQNGVEASLKVDAVLIRIGVEPNTEFISEHIEIDSAGYIQADKFGKTSNPYIYAIGDVCNLPKYSSLSVSGGQGMVAVKKISELLDDRTN